MSTDFQSQSAINHSLPEPYPETDLANSGHFQTYSDMNLTDIQLRAIDLLIQGHTDTQTARMLSINPKTLWRWKTQNEEYREALTEARHQLHSTVSDRYQNLIFRATAILVKFLEDPTDTTRMKAAQILLNIASRYKPAPAPRRPTNNLSEDDDWPAPVFEPKVG